MSKKPLSLEDFTAIYSKVPRLNVELCIIDGGRIVLTKRAIEPCIGQWHVPGGTVHFGETVEETIHRVAKDECGVEVEIQAYLGSIVYPQMYNDGYFGWPIGLAYKLKIISGELTVDEEADAIELFDTLPDNVITDQKKFFEALQPRLF